MNYLINSNHEVARSSRSQLGNPSYQTTAMRDHRGKLTAHRHGKEVSKNLNQLTTAQPGVGKRHYHTGVCSRRNSNSRRHNRFGTLPKRLAPNGVGRCEKFDTELNIKTLSPNKYTLISTTAMAEATAQIRGRLVGTELTQSNARHWIITETPKPEVTVVLLT